MKNKLLMVASLVLAFALGGAGTYVYGAITRQPTNTARFQSDVVYDANNNPVSVPIQVWFRNKSIVDDVNPSKNTGANDWAGPYLVDLMADPVRTTTYTAAGKTNSGLQIAAALNAVFNAEQVRQSVP